MTRKSQRNQEMQQGKAAKAYGGYLPSVEDDGRDGRTAHRPDSLDQEVTNREEPENR